MRRFSVRYTITLFAIAAVTLWASVGMAQTPPQPVVSGWAGPTAAGSTLFLDPAFGEERQEAQEQAFLDAVAVSSMIDFDDLTAGPVRGTEWIRQGAIFFNPDGVRELRLGESSEQARTPPNWLAPVDPGQMIEIVLTVPVEAFGFWLIDSEFLAPGDSIDYFDMDGELILSIPMPTTGFRTSSPEGNFFIGFISDVLIARIRINEHEGDGDTVPIDSLYLGAEKAGPECDIQLSREVYIDGDRVVTQVRRIANTGDGFVPVEVALWVESPDARPESFFKIGADGLLRLPPGFDFDLGPAPVFRVTPDLPRGTYAFNCRMVDPVTLRVLAQDVNLFEIE